MSETKIIKCPYCGIDATSQAQEGFEYVFVECPVCGRYEHKVFPKMIAKDMKDEIASYLFYNGKYDKDSRFYNFLGDQKYFEKEFAKYPWCHHVTLEEVNAFYPRSFSERITMILLRIAEESQFLGDIIQLSYEKALSAMFVHRHDKEGKELEKKVVHNQLKQIINYLEENKFIETETDCDNVKITLLPDGWKRVDELQADEKNNKNVFVSMAFNETTEGTREALRKGIVNAGYSPKFIDEIIHNKQIVPEMFRLIRESRFLILDISEPNYGAYYEAGYALGLGKEVIICCKAEIFTKQYETDEEKKYQKYLKPHFDVAQKQILVWDDYDDLSKKLAEWIKAII